MGSEGGYTGSSKTKRRGGGARVNGKGRKKIMVVEGESATKTHPRSVERGGGEVPAKLETWEVGRAWVD